MIVYQTPRLQRFQRSPIGARWKNYQATVYLFSFTSHLPPPVRKLFIPILFFQHSPTHSTNSSRWKSKLRFCNRTASTLEVARLLVLLLPLSVSLFLSRVKCKVRAGGMRPARMGKCKTNRERVREQTFTFTSSKNRLRQIWRELTRDNHKNWLCNKPQKKNWGQTLHVVQEQGRRFRCFKHPPLKVDFFLLLFHSFFPRILTDLGAARAQRENISRSEKQKNKQKPVDH